jgi:hypothetical protein
MDIRNVTQFSNFISENELTSLDHVFKQIPICLADFSRRCNCHRKEDKSRIYSKCNVFYINAVKIAAARFKNEFLSKTPEKSITFYNENGSLIMTMHR